MNAWLGKYLVGVGVFIAQDGIASIWAYRNDPKQSWKWDHSFRICRALVGVSLIVVGAMV